MNQIKDKPSIFGGRRALIKWVRAQNNGTLQCAVRSIVAEHIDIDHIGRSKVVQTLPEHVLTEVHLIQRELGARARAQAKVSDLCASANGIAYHSTQGWWITPMLTERGTIGLLNTSKGVALDTGVHLSASEALAVALPLAPLASANAAAESHRAGKPDGWRQLACDSRGGTAKPVSEIMPEARVVATCLMTCYGTPGEPDATYERCCGWPREHVSPFCAQ